MVFRLLFLVLSLLVLTACGSRTESPQTPPSPAAPTVEADISAEQHRIISVRLDEIRIANDIDRAIPLDTVWMIPLNSGQDVTARMQYAEEGQNIIILPDKPYVPTSPWFISIERSDLEGENFGLWFVVVNVGENSLVTWEEFNQIMLDVAIILGSGAVGSMLTVTTPVVPDEAVVAPVMIERGASLLTTISVMGSRFMANLQQQSSDMVSDFSQRQLDKLVEATERLDSIPYFSEVYVIVPSANDYYLNNQISAITADGSLEIVFSIFETDNLNDSDFTATEKRSDIFPPTECNPASPSQLQAGVQAQIVEQNVNVLENILSEDLADFRLRRNDVVTTIFPFCQVENSTLWWRIQTASGEFGFVPESTGTRIFMEPVANE